MCAKIGRKGMRAGMTYKIELQFLLDTLKKCHVPVQLIPRDKLHDGSLDMGLRALLQLNESILHACADRNFAPREEKVYILTDRFGCHYLFFLLPRAPEPRLFFVGPYVSRVPVRETILEKCEKWGIPPILTTQIENYYGSMPIVSEEYLFAIVDTFCERIWRQRMDDHVVTLYPGMEEESPVLLSPQRNEKADWNLQLVEQRYAYENEMLMAVAKGQIHKARAFMSVFSTMSFEKRLSDPVRNLKNYCIIMNTLLRKAAESGGVHPVFLDRMSSAFAMKIEQMNAIGDGGVLMTEMFESYCRMVRQHSTRDYSPPVQKSITAIESDLSQDLSLSALAAMQCISKSYLSTLFKKETDMTVTEYVNHRRIEYAALLLSTTQLQVQTVAQHCGMMDVQYFSKLFKRIKGLTPHEYRRHTDHGDE